MVFFFNDTATTEIYTLSLHDALPISAPDARLALAGPAHDREGAEAVGGGQDDPGPPGVLLAAVRVGRDSLQAGAVRSEEHTSEIQSRQYLVFRLLLLKKKTHHK